MEDLFLHATERDLEPTFPEQGSPAVPVAFFPEKVEEKRTGDRLCNIYGAIKGDRPLLRLRETMTQAAMTGGAHEAMWRMSPRGLRWRVLVSILAGTGWLIFVLLYVAFVPTGFTLFQSLVVIFASILALGAALGALWVSWGMRQPQ